MQQCTVNCTDLLIHSDYSQSRCISHSSYMTFILAMRYLIRKARGSSLFKMNYGSLSSWDSIRTLEHLSVVKKMPQCVWECHCEDAAGENINTWQRLIIQDFLHFYCAGCCHIYLKQESIKSHLLHLSGLGTVKTALNLASSEWIHRDSSFHYTRTFASKLTLSCVCPLL